MPYLLIPINGISTLTELFSAQKAQKIISNLLKKKPSGCEKPLMVTTRL